MLKLPPMAAPSLAPFCATPEVVKATGLFGRLLQAGKSVIQFELARNPEKIRLLQASAAVALQRGEPHRAGRDLQTSGYFLWQEGQYSQAEQAWVRSAQVVLGLSDGGTQEENLILQHLVSRGVLMANINRSMLPASDFLVNEPVGFGTVATVYKVFGENVVFKVSGRIFHLVDIERSGPSVLDCSRDRFRNAAKQLQKLNEAGLRIASILFAGDDLIVQELVHGVSIRNLSRCEHLDPAVLLAAQQSFRDYVSAAAMAGIGIDRPHQNLLFDLAKQQWVAVDA